MWTCLPARAPAGEILPETVARIGYGEPPAEVGWSPASQDEFPWKPQAFVRGWQTTTPTGDRAGIFVAFQSPTYRISNEELFANMSSSLSENFGADGWHNLIHTRPLSRYNGMWMKFAADAGTGVFFDADADTPTTAMFIYVQLEPQPESDIWPLLLLFFSAPADAYDELEPGFLEFVKTITIAPPPASGASERRSGGWSDLLNAGMIGIPSLAGGSATFVVALVILAGLVVLGGLVAYYILLERALLEMLRFGVNPVLLTFSFLSLIPLPPLVVMGVVILVLWGHYRKVLVLRDLAQKKQVRDGAAEPQA